MLTSSRKMFVRFFPLSYIVFDLITCYSNAMLVEKVDYVNVLTAMLLNGTVTNDCTNQILFIKNALSSGTHSWAFKMLDATAKPNSGILMGNIMHMGNYDECLEIDEHFNGERIEGKYCRAFWQPHPQYGQLLKQQISSLGMNLPQTKNPAVAIQFSYAFCVPKVCTARDLRKLADILENENKFPLHFNFMDEYCDTRDGQPFTASAVVAIAVFSTFAAIVVCSTLYDIFSYGNRGETDKKPNLFIAFSVVTNAKQLLSASTVEGNLDCLNGLRVISIMWIMLGHTIALWFVSPLVNTVHIAAWKSAPENAFLVAAPMAVDTFLTISGLLVVHQFMKSQNNGVKFSLPMFYLHRILRLTPSLAMTVLFTATLLKYMGNGPIWPVVDEIYQKPCERKWWSTLMYLQMDIWHDDECLPYLWYLAVDTQMYFLSPIILFLLVKWPKKTIKALCAIIILNCSYVFGITWKKRLSSTYFNIVEGEHDYIYGRTHVRGTVYLLGMICGFFVYKTRTSRPLKLHKLRVMIFWISSLLVMSGIVLAHTAVIVAPEYNALKTSSFNSLTRVSWSVALSTIILLCVNGYGGLVNSFLSSKIFIVLIRLNYNVYLLHVIVMVAIAAQTRVPAYFSNLHTFSSFGGYYIFTLGAAFVWTLVFESPIVIIEKVVFGRKKKITLGGSVLV